MILCQKLPHLIEVQVFFSKLFKIPEKSLKDFMAKSMYNHDITISYNLTLDTAIEFVKEIDDKLNSQQYPALWEHRKNRNIIKSALSYKKLLQRFKRKQ